MASLIECTNTIITKLNTVLTVFDQIFCETIEDRDGYDMFGYKQDVVKQITQSGSIYKVNTIYNKGDILTYKGDIFIAKLSSQGQKPEDNYYFKHFSKLKGDISNRLNLKGYYSITRETDGTCAFNGLSRGVINPTANTNGVDFENDFGSYGRTYMGFHERTLTDISDGLDYNLDYTWERGSHLYNYNYTAGTYKYTFGGVFIHMDG